MARDDIFRKGEKVYVEGKSFDYYFKGAVGIVVGETDTDTKRTCLIFEDQPNTPRGHWWTDNHCLTRLNFRQRKVDVHDEQVSS